MWFEIACEINEHQFIWLTGARRRMNITELNTNFLPRWHENDEKNGFISDSKMEWEISWKLMCLRLVLVGKMWSCRRLWMSVYLGIEWVSVYVDYCCRDEDVSFEEQSIELSWAKQVNCRPSVCEIACTKAAETSQCGWPYTDNFSWIKVTDEEGICWAIWVKEWAMFGVNLGGQKNVFGAE